MSSHRRFLGDKDIESYLQSLEGGYVSEDGLEDSDDDEENLITSYANREQLLQELEDEENAENIPPYELNESDPPLIPDETQTDISDPPIIQNEAHSSRMVFDKRKLIWKKRNLQFSETNIQFKGNTNLGPEANLETPYQCFTYFFPDTLIKSIAYETHLYKTQQNIQESQQFTEQDIQNFIGILIYMSVQCFPSTRSYWSPQFGYNPIKNTMPVNKFEKIKRYLHFNDNSTFIQNGAPGHDRLHKIRPLVDTLNERFSSVTMKQRLSVDEQMCATKVGHYLKQYLPNKPHKWGFKLYVLCSIYGFAYRFEIYSGQDLTSKPEGEPDLGPTSNVVLRLMRIVPRMVNHIIFFDNFYTALPLVYYLAQQGIFSLGTVQQNRLPNSKLPDKKEMMKKNVARGTYHERTTSYDGIEMSTIAWKDNKIVTLLSSYVGALPTTTVNRYDRSKKEKIAIDCPKAVTEYNAHMGGVDLMDSFLGRYNIRLKSRKWYIRIFFHLLDLSIINSWIVYKENAIRNQVPKKDILNLGKFRNELAFILCNRMVKECKRGRPSTSSLEHELAAKKRRGPTKPVPAKEVRNDGVEHYPYIGVSQRCKYPNCTGYSTINCSKCGINLCLNKKNNCFVKFHTE